MVDEQEEQKPDIKLAEFELKEGSILIIKKTTYNGEERIDFRVWKNTSTYKGPTKQGFVLTMDKVDEFIKSIENMKKKLSK